MSVTIINPQAPTNTTPINGTKTVPTVSIETIVASSTLCKRGVLVIADKNNTHTIYVGGSALTTSNGVDLEAREARFYEVSDAIYIYCISSDASQVLRYEII